MLHVLPASNKKSFGEKANNALGAFFNQYNEMQQQKQQALAGEKLSQLTGMDLSGLSPDMQKIALAEALRSQGKDRRLEQTQNLLGQIFGQGNKNSQMGDELMRGESEPSLNQGGFDASSLSDAQIAQVTSLDPNLGRVLQHQRDVDLRENRENRTEKRREFEKEREFHSSFSKEANKEIEGLRSTLPRKEMALDFARNAIETGDLSYFSPDKLADATGIDLFRTAKGSQLATAAKENLLGNMSRISARGLNQWMEQRLNTMFPKIGQSREANLTAQEMLEAESAMDRAYLSEYDRLAAQDEEQYGFERKDIAKRARQAVSAKQKEIFNRASYRIKEIEEQEKGLSSLKSQVGKNVIKGTPLTLAMAKLYKQKFGDNALSVAKKNGYYIPSIEEFQIYQSRPQEFRGDIE